MHYYGVYAIAKAAGIRDEDAQIIAYASQYVDDATSEDSKTNESDGGILVGFSTSHHLLGNIVPRMDLPEYQRKVWVPCHFIPGGAGKNLEEKCLCLPDSAIARDMFRNHINMAKSGIKYGLELVGIAAHAYMDTFSHYGFSGFSSKFNQIDTPTLRIWTESDEEYDRLKPKIASLETNKKNLCVDIKNFFHGFASNVAQTTSGALGHGGVLSFPDRPYLRWNFDFILDRPGNGKKSARENHKDYLDACKNLYGFLCEFSAIYERPYGCRKFEEVEGLISEILKIEGDSDIRANGWIKSGLVPNGAHYSCELWENQKKEFSKYANSEKGIDSEIYRFHQAAAYHRYYMLKDLLPRYGIAAH
jgi:hypothetical protein